MGCCLSTSTTQKSTPLGHQKHQISQPPTSKGLHESRAPPPVDEETVKEVLSISVSETPRPKPAPAPASPAPPPSFTMPHQGHVAADHQDPDEEKLPQEPVFEKEEKKTEQQEDYPEKVGQKIPIGYNNGEISEVSEICSLSESLSATTITRDEDEEVSQTRVNRSPMKLRQNRDGSMGHRRHRVVGKSPDRRTESSPGRRYGQNGNYGAGSVRLVQQSKEPGLGRGQGQQPMSRHPGESLGRRSSSPATRFKDGGGVNRANVGRSPSARRSGRYLGRTTVGSVDSSGSNRRVAEEVKMEEEEESKLSSTNNESIDNPLVSLECFIFL